MAIEIEVAHFGNGGNLPEQPQRIEAPLIERHPAWSPRGLRDPGDLVLEVRDSGPGVAEGLSEQIFQEGFSTKAKAGKRRGFGLALVRQVARRMGGEVTLVNQGGALFTVRLPLRVPVRP